MGYQSMQFLVFSGIVLLLYYLAGRKRQKYVLLLGNTAFFLIAGAEYIPFILTTMCASFFAGKKMGAIYEELDERLKNCEAGEKKQLRAQAKARAKGAMLAALAVSVALLAVCKYTGFVVDNINVALGWLGVAPIPLFRMILPIGISFYTFMALSYVLDIYWRRYGAEKNFVFYAVYLSYFPHVVQGPIDRYQRFRDQIGSGVALDCKNLAYGAQLALWGLFQKLVIADRLGVFVDTVYDGWEQYTGTIFVLATVLYSVQIYADFSGCIDIVTGISEMFGIKLDRNFDHPYFSRTMPEFWRRWHISLGEWFKDYIYYPVSVSTLVKNRKKHYRDKGNKRGEVLFASCFPAFVVWVVTGIWHGAAWKFVAWGLYHAALIILGNVFSDFNAGLVEKAGIRTDTIGWRLWQTGRTFALCCVGRVFFRANSIGAAFGIFRNTLRDLSFIGIRSGYLYQFGLNSANFWFAMLAILVLLAVDLLQEHLHAKDQRVRDLLARENLPVRWAVIYLAILLILIFGMYGPEYDASSFIYDQF